VKGLGFAARAGLGALLTLGLGASALGCAATPADSAEEAIVGGTRETGFPAVYFMYRLDGAACTAALISPRVVLTARHCVVNGSGTGTAPASYFRLYRGTDQRSFTAEYRVSRVEIIPGSSDDIGDGRAQDVALLVLSAPAAETPYEIARDRTPGAIVGMTSTAVGFGQTPSGNSGVKYRVATTVTDVYSGLLFVDPTVCSGDSGGPLIGPDNRVYGVASFIYSPDMRSEPRCGTAPGAYNEIYRHIDWINGVIESVGDACFPEAEVCDGLDNDCNEMVDETCSALGEPCTDGSECVGGLCAATPAGAVCSQACDPMRPGFGCPPSFYCASEPGFCDGFCVPGALGLMPLETACSADTECASGLCRDPGDGLRRCLDPCRGDRGDCLDGNVCVAADGACSVCIDASRFGSPRGLGEICSDDTQCRSGLCVVRAGIGECSTPCGAGDSCGEGFSCTDGNCLLDREQPVGGPCLTSADCARGAVCAAQGDRRWCTATCSADAPCPLGFSCVDVGSMICAPAGGLTGEACSIDMECSTGMCREGTCTAPCSSDNRCGPGFLCEALADGTRACFAPPPVAPPGSGGCAAVPSDRTGDAAGWAMAALALGVVVARRRRR
jgi:MYXO-CTERM domain-containing protein